jgi:methionyl-tRNA formyltransferase
MRVVILTTDTPHHRYYASALAEQFAVRGIVVERSGPRPSFDTLHPFEGERDAYEREVLLRGVHAPFNDVAETCTVSTINDPEAIAAIREFEPDVSIIFGTRRCRTPIVEGAKIACLNLHGGNPEQYRGLDTHLWAIYHRDFDNLITTLHIAANELDAGDIVAQSRVDTTAGMALHQLRAANTRCCVELSLAALTEVSAGRPLPRRRQISIGRYYSFMPAVLKEVCVRHFAAFTATP